MEIGGCDREHACIYKCFMSAVHVDAAAASAPRADAGGPAARLATESSPSPTHVQRSSTTSPQATRSPHDVDPSQDSVSGDEERPGGR
jgi:hypothetical protein